MNINTASLYHRNIKRSSLSNATSVESKRLTKKLRVLMFETVKKLRKTVLTVEKSGMIHFLLIILLLLNGVHNMDPDFPIQAGDFEYVVSIQLSNVHLCTGTIIHEHHVLTIAHLLISKYKPELSVVAGVNAKMNSSDHKFSVEKVYMHHELQIRGPHGDYWENDIAIIKLAEKFTIHNPVPVAIVQPASLPCLDCVMISWIYPQSENKELLAKTYDFVYSMSDEDCDEWNINVLENQHCVSNILGDSLMTSDNLGSPIICLNFLVGLVAKGTENKIERTPAAYVETAAYKDFFFEIVNEGLVDVLPKETISIVSIWYKNSSICGGSILDSWHILTTANCVVGLERTQLMVIAGYHRISGDGNARTGLSVKDIVFHENSTEHDIAVLVLEDAVLYTLTWYRLDYGNAREFYPGLLCTSYHWKSLQHNDGMEVIKLRRSSMDILPTEKCKSILESQNITPFPNHFCASNPYRFKVANHSDRGNPIVTENEPVAILVGVLQLADDPPEVAIFLSLYPYMEFIRSALQA